MKPQDKLRAEATLIHLKAKTQSILSNLTDQSLLRCVLMHDDFHNYNILVNDGGDITAVLDWEINTIRPAILSVDYPRWLSDQAHYDTRFACDDEWWEESPSERKRLRAVFEQMVKERHPKMHKCHMEGRDLRGIMDWLMNLHDDPGFDRIGAWLSSL